MKNDNEKRGFAFHPTEAEGELVGCFIPKEGCSRGNLQREAQNTISLLMEVGSAEQYTKLGQRCMDQAQRLRDALDLLPAELIRARQMEKNPRTKVLWVMSRLPCPRCGKENFLPWKDTGAGFECGWCEYFIPDAIAVERLSKMITAICGEEIAVGAVAKIKEIFRLQ